MGIIGAGYPFDLCERELEVLLRRDGDEETPSVRGVGVVDDANGEHPMDPV